MLDLKRVERPLSGIRLHDWFSQMVKIIVNEKRTAAAKSKSARTGLSVADSAMKGGIDLTPASQRLAIVSRT